jgi:pyrroloquinoline quinone biosynthesis protein D
MARLILTAHSIPRLPRHIVLRHDKTRDRWVILAPERVLVPDDIAVTVLQRLDGRKTIGEIAADLARDYAAPVAQIESDITALLQDLADKNFLTATEAAHG